MKNKGNSISLKIKEKIHDFKIRGILFAWKLGGNSPFKIGGILSPWKIWGENSKFQNRGNFLCLKIWGKFTISKSNIYIIRNLIRNLIQKSSKIPLNSQNFSEGAWPPRPPPFPKKISLLNIEVYILIYEFNKFYKIT